MIKDQEIDEALDKLGHKIARNIGTLVRNQYRQGRQDALHDAATKIDKMPRGRPDPSVTAEWLRAMADDELGLL